MNSNEIEDLLLRIAEKEINREDAERAFEILYKKYSPLIYNAVKKGLYFKSESDRNVFANTVTDNTFLEVFEHPLKFDSREKSSVEASFKAYLFAIAQNERSDLFKESTNYKSKQLHIIDDDSKFFEPEFTDDQLEPIVEELSKNRKILDEFLISIPERDKHILLEFYNYYEEGKYSPSEVLDRLESIHGTSRENIRTIRSRVTKRIIDYIEARTNLKALK